MRTNNTTRICEKADSVSREPCHYIHQEQHGRASCWSSWMYDGCSGLPRGENTDDEQQSSSSGADDKDKENQDCTRVWDVMKSDMKHIAFATCDILVGLSYDTQHYVNFSSKGLLKGTERTDEMCIQRSRTAGPSNNASSKPLQEISMARGTDPACCKSACCLQL